MRVSRVTSSVACVALLLAAGCDKKATMEMDASQGAAPADPAPRPDAALDDASAASADASSAADAGDAGGCGAARRLRCGDRLTGSTPSGGENRLSGYACTARAESGPEEIYAFEPEQGCRVSARLSALAVDLDLFVLDRCDAQACTQRSSTPLDLQEGGERVAFDAPVGRSQVVVVDGYDESFGSYSLAVDCLCGEAAKGFSDGNFRLRVNRRWNHDLTGVALAATPLAEDDYLPVDDGARYTVVVSEGWQHVTVEPDGQPPFMGKLVGGAAGALHYELDAGTFAGGRVSIWAAPAGLEAELTLYGSGVPVVSSERGSLIVER
jgi:hypothetical protein